MPIYEYECTKCGHNLEALQKPSEEALTECPECKASTLQKLVSAAGFQLKGTGWYATDFRNKGKPAEKTSTSTTDSGTKTEAKKDTGTTTS
jgi:putative FmdB family regulatory protein